MEVRGELDDANRPTVLIEIVGYSFDVACLIDTGSDLPLVVTDYWVFRRMINNVEVKVRPKYQVKNVRSITLADNKTKWETVSIPIVVRIGEDEFSTRLSFPIKEPKRQSTGNGQEVWPNSDEEITQQSYAILGNKLLRFYDLFVGYSRKHQNKEEPAVVLLSIHGPRKIVIDGLSKAEPTVIDLR